jgi:hypothetical protein
MFPTRTMRHNRGRRWSRQALLSAQIVTQIRRSTLFPDFE